MKTSEKIKKIFDKSNLSYQELEDLTGIGRSSLQRYANGVTEKIPVDAIEIIAKKFNVSPVYLMGWEEKDENIYGNHKENLDYFAKDPELLAFYKDMHASDNLKLLFDTGRELTPDELEKVLRYMKMVMDGSL